MIPIDSIKKLEQSINKKPFSFIQTLVINPVYTTVSTNLQGLSSDFLCTAMNISIYDDNKCVLDTDPQREQILLQLSKNGENYSIFQFPIDTSILNAISNNNNFPSFIISKEGTWTLTVNQVPLVGTPILVAPITIQVTLSGYYLNNSN